MNPSDYQDLMKHPPRSARPKTRWWWYGCKVKEEDIVFQLDEMQKAGIGGVELQITYPLQAGDDNCAWFSPDYFRMLSFTSSELKKRGMTLDLTLGSSWPFGGPFVPFSKSAVHIIPLELTVQGPTRFSYDFTNRVAGELIGCVMGQMDGCEMIPETIQDLSEYLADRLLYNWPWGTKLSDVPIPDGIWKIVIFAASQFREHVLMPTRGAEGYVIDHNNRDAMRFFLEHAGTPIVERLGKGAVNHFFCDSLEVFGHNWSINLYEAFEQRRGYSLKPYIYALWGNIKGMTDKIRYDFHKTLSELTIDGFFEEMTRWCHEVGSLSRIQAHGTWGDVLLAYGAADIPEGETFSAWDKFSVNTVHRRLASSAGHLYGRNIISNESFTWLRFPRFCETPEQIKIAADSIFVDGINQIVNHGYSYSPKDGGGNHEELYFYASSNISHTNTWWRYYPHVSSYIARTCAFLQQGTHKATICIYLPQADVWAENPLSDLHMCMKLEEKIETATVDAIAQEGYWFDYINDDAIEQGKLSEYEALIILETKRVPGESARQIHSYAMADGCVICAGSLPEEDCGMKGSFDVKELFEQMVKEGVLKLVPDKKESLLTCLKQEIVPDLTVTEGKQDIGYVHRSLEDGRELYFVANMSRNAYHTCLKFRDSYQAALVLDPLTGQQIPVVSVCDDIFPAVSCDPTSAGFRLMPGQQGAKLFLTFPEGQSFLLIMDQQDPSCDHMPKSPQQEDTGMSLPALQRFLTIQEDARSLRKIDLSRDWELSVPTIGFHTRVDTLDGFEQLDALRYFSGEAIYRKRFSLRAEEAAASAVVLRIEQVHCCATVLLNGRVITDWIMRPYEADLTPYIIIGENELEIHVSNLLINRFIDPEKKIYEYPDQLMDEWPYFPQQLIKERGKRLDAWRERAMISKPLPSGLVGKAFLLLRF